MFLGFRIKNYKSIADEIFIDFRAKTSLREHEYVLHDEGGVKVLPIISIYGANGSGKSNIFGAFQAFNFFVFNVKALFTDIDYFDISHSTAPFLFGENKELPTEFEAYFSYSGAECRYGFAIKDNDIVEEWLFERKLSAKSETKWKILFERDEEKTGFGKGFADFKAYSDLIDNKILMFNFLGNLKVTKAEKFNNLFKGLYKLLSLPCLSYPVSKVPDGVYFNDIRLLKELNSFMKLADPTIDEIKIEFDDLKKEYLCCTIRKGIKAPFEIESDGTKKIYSLFWLLHEALEKGLLLVVDELDCQIHPLLLRKIVRMFHDKEINRNGAQLFFTSHNIILFDSRDFRRDEIWFTEKDAEGRTTVFSLADFEYNDRRVRADLDYGKHYLLGRFGAVPFMDMEGPHA